MQESCILFFHCVCMGFDNRINFWGKESRENVYFCIEKCEVAVCKIWLFDKMLLLFVKPCLTIGILGKIVKAIFISYNSLNDLAEFIVITDVGLTNEVPEGDYKGLVDVMGHLMAVKDRTTTTDAMFEPLKHTIELLRSYDQEMSEETHSLLQVYICYVFKCHDFVTRTIAITLADVKLSFCT